MIRRIALLTLALCALAARGARAQEGTWNTIRRDADNVADDVVHVWTSPFRARESALPGVAVLAGAMLLVGWQDGQLQQWLRDHPRAVPVRVLSNFRDSTPISKLGYTMVLLPLSGALYGAGLLLDADDLREAGIGCATADVANTLARHALARLVGRLRPEFTADPYVIEIFAFGDWEMRSFPGGHAANIAACTTFWNRRFDLGVAEPALYTLAVGIGLGRTLDDAHWASDTLFGLVFGWAVGRIVADRFLERRPGETAPPAAALAPGRAPPAFRIGWRIPL